MAVGIGFFVFLFAIVMLLASSFRILREYERGVVFQLGRFWKVKGPGLVVIIPVFQQMVRVDLRTIVMDVKPQDVITRDNVSVKVDAVIYFRVVDPEKSVIQVAAFLEATSQLAQTTLRAVVGKHSLDELLSEREQLNLAIQRVLDTQTDAWGIKVSTVEIKQVDLNESMVRAIARQAEAERERRAKIIHAVKANCRRRRSSCKPRKCSRSSRRPSNCATCRRWATSRATAVPSSCFRCRSSCWLLVLASARRRALPNSSRSFQFCLREADIQALHSVQRLHGRRLFVQGRGIVDSALAEEQDQSVRILDARDRGLRILLDRLLEMLECCVLLRTVCHAGDQTAHLVDHFGLV